MAFPWSYKQKVEIKVEHKEMLKAEKHIAGYLKQKIQKLKYDDFLFEGQILSFVSYNSLFSVASPIKFSWDISDKFILESEFEMTNFVRLLSFVSLLVGLLGSLTFRHYLVLTFLAVLILYLLNFFILSVFVKKMTNDVLALCFPEYIELKEIEDRKMSLNSDSENYSSPSHTKSTNFSIHYDFTESKENLREKEKD